MIKLVDVAKYYLTNFGRHYVFRDVNLELPLDKSVAVLGPNGAGKSTFLRLLGGADEPSYGTIVRVGRISPPMGLTPGLQQSLNAAENARFAGRIYGLGRHEINEMIEYVRELADIGKYFDMPVSTYSAGMRQRVAFAINMSMDFDYYLFDEIAAGGDREFRKMAKQKVYDRLSSSKFIMTSHKTGELLELCDAGIVIRSGELTYFDDVRDAVMYYGENPDEELRLERQEDGETEDGGERRTKQKRRGVEGYPPHTASGDAAGSNSGAEQSNKKNKKDSPKVAARSVARAEKRENRNLARAEKRAARVNKRGSTAGAPVGDIIEGSSPKE